MTQFKINSVPLLKVNTINCNHFRQLSGKQISMEQLKQLIDSQLKINRVQYLSASGQSIGVDRSSIKYSNATYLFLVIDAPTCLSGEKIVAWCYRRKAYSVFSKMDFCSESDFNIIVAKMNECAVGSIKFENQRRKQEFLQEIQNLLPFKYELSKLEKIIKEAIPNYSMATLSTDNKISFDTKLIDARGRHIFVEGFISRRDNTYIIINPSPHCKTLK